MGDNAVPEAGAEQRARDIEALAEFAEEHAKPIAALAAFMSGDLGPMWLVVRALEVAARERAAGTVRPEVLADFEAAAQIAARRILAAWEETEDNLAYRDALTRATQRGGVA